MRMWKCWLCMVALGNFLAYAVRHAGMACVAMSLFEKVWHVLCRSAECFADDMW
jgi:hypothetical protein